MKITLKPIDQITIGTRFRKDYNTENLRMLRDSLSTKGLIQPITISPEGELIAGGRRLRAAIELGWQEIPTIIRETNEIDLREVELIENTHRQDMTWQEVSSLVKEIHDLNVARDSTWTQEQTGKVLQFSKSYISDLINLQKALKHFPDLDKMPTFKEAVRMFKQKAKDLYAQDIAEKMIPTTQQTLKTLEIYRPTSASEGAEPRSWIKDLQGFAGKIYRVTDTFQGMAELKALYQSQMSSIQVIECDPPYGIDLHDVKKVEDSLGESELEAHYTEVPDAEYDSWLQCLLDDLFEISATRCWLILWFDIKKLTRVYAALRSSGWQFDEMPCIWSKLGSGGALMNPDIHLARSYETFILARKGAPALQGQGRSNVFHFPVATGNKKWHPAQRPYALIKEILETVGLNGGICFVPFLGSGATLVAATSLGWPCFGFDNSPVYRDRFLHAVSTMTERDLA